MITMFKKILIPISSEFYSKNVLEKGTFLAKKFDSSISLVYIIEEKTLNQTDRIVDLYRTTYDRVETKRKIVRNQMRTADAIVFDDAKRYFTNYNIPLEEKVVKGEFSSVVKNEVIKKHYDLIVMGYEKGCILNYRLLDEVHVPIWIVGQHNGRSMLAVCSNLAPNQKVPEISTNLSKFLGWNLYMLYIVDTQDSVEVDKHGVRSDKKPPEQLISKGEIFVNNMKKKGIDARLVTGVLEKETIKVAEDLNVDLIIVGREQKKNRILGLPMKSIKHKMADRCPYSILFIN